MPVIYPKTNHGRASDYVAVPRKVFKEFLNWQKIWQKSIKPIRTSKLTAAEKKALARARKNFARGKFITLEQLEHKLDSNN